MAAQNGSTAAGTGQIVKASDSFTLTIKLTGDGAHVEPRLSHSRWRLRRPGGIVYALQQVIADASGAATATTIVPAKYLVPSSGWYVNVHNGPDFTEPAYAPSTSCGDLSAA